MLEYIDLYIPIAVIVVTLIVLCRRTKRNWNYAKDMELYFYSARPDGLVCSGEVCPIFGKGPCFDKIKGNPCRFAVQEVQDVSK